jgi:apolipoprotein D and lipocalin family protein
MKSRILFVLSAFVMSFISVSAHAEIQTVPHVDVNRYLGDWYQISHVPLWFEGSSVCACARQRLTSTSQAGVIGILNTCTKDDGSPYSIAGTASDDDASTNAKLTVSFEGVPFKGSYWIIGLDPQYRFAVVTDRGGDALYILSRTPTLAKSLYQDAVAMAAGQVDTSKLAGTKQLGCTYPK